MTRVRLLVATGCHLCPAAVATVTTACASRGLVPEIVDIDGVLDLERRYRSAIPVVEVDGREVGRFVIDAHGLAQALDAAS